MLSEIHSMPAMAQHFLDHAPAYQLPQGVPYIGMGSSYFAPLAFKFMGVNISPEMASEFYNYLPGLHNISNAVLLSQSGRSTEVLWCAAALQKFTVLTNDVQSKLAQCAGAEQVIGLLAGEEKYSSSKTYINTLLALFKGFGIEVQDAVRILQKNFSIYQQQGNDLAEAIYNILQQEKITGIYITGSGPNIATALQAALILSESTKINFTGLPMAQYDHGPKETARHSIVIQILAKGKSYERTRQLAATIKAAGAHVFTVEEPAVTENESVIHNMIPFNFLAYYLSEKLEIKDTFLVGGKVTEVV